MVTLPKVAFDRESVRVFVPKTGWAVYHILGHASEDGTREVCYVGASKNPRSRILDHVRSGQFPEAELVAVERFQSSTAMARRERELTDALGQVEFGRRHAAWRARPSKVAA